MATISLESDYAEPEHGHGTIYVPMANIVNNNVDYSRDARR
jgi:hypothetical protein